MRARPFIHRDFLLESEAAQGLFHDCARDLPVIDYHTHLSPEMIAKDHHFRNLAEMWLDGDHYKWRAMRTDGVDERLITGDATDWNKFSAWAGTMPRLLRNPLHHWTQLELMRLFEIEDLLGPDTAKSVWEKGNAMLTQPDLSCRGILKRMNVALVCTTDDPTDSLEHHRAIAADDSITTRVLPTWRPDRALAVTDTRVFNAWIDRLAAVADIEIADFDSFMEAMQRRHQVFHEMGCRLSDHGVEVFPADDFSEASVKSIFDKLRANQPLNEAQIMEWQSALLHLFAIMDHERGWIQQYHIGPVRNPRSRMMERLGPDSGFDCMGDSEVIRPLARFLDRLDREDKLARTILYHHHPKDGPSMIVLAGSFQQGPHPGKIQVGPPWWFLDQRDGIERQIEDLSQMSLLSRFIGMVTDSRSFPSLTRHEYFRRILCQVLGRDLERGLIPDDRPTVESLVKAVCHENAARCFDL